MDNLTVVHVHSDDIKENILHDIEYFCKECELELDKPAKENMEFTDWENKPNTLLYLLLKTNQFSKNNGIFSFLYDNDRIVASSGAYKSEFDENVVIGAVRAWKSSKFRGGYFIANNIMPYHLNWAKENNSKIFALTFNEYNYKLMRIMNRSEKYEKSRNSHFLFGSKRPTFYQDMDVLPFTVLIKNTKQYVLYTKLDIDYEPKWPRIY